MSKNDLLENVDVAELIKHVDIEDLVKQVDLWELLKRVNLGSVLGGFGAAAGGEVGARVGTWLDSALGIDEDSSGDEPNGSAADESPSDDGTVDGEPDAESPESREDLEALSYQELQSLTDGTDVKGNVSKDRMVDELAAEFGFE